MSIYIVRHGETIKNREKTLQGRSNFPLNEEGRQQAIQAAEYFSREKITFTTVYSSPLTRAVETAELICRGQNEIVADDRLIEMDYGPYEGISLEHPPQEILTFFADFVHNPAPEGMESLSGVKTRAADFLKSLQGKTDENILISTHAIAMKGILEVLTPEANGAFWSRFIPNCGIYRFEVEKDGYSIPQEVQYQAK